MYGWRDSRSGLPVHVHEEGPGQTFEVGYLKPGSGTLPEITLTVRDVVIDLSQEPGIVAASM